MQYGDWFIQQRECLRIFARDLAEYQPSGKPFDEEKYRTPVKGGWASMSGDVEGWQEWHEWQNNFPSRSPSRSRDSEPMHNTDTVSLLQGRNEAIKETVSRVKEAFKGLAGPGAAPLRGVPVPGRATFHYL